MSNLWPNAGDQPHGPRRRPSSHAGILPCARCGGTGGWRYVYCTTCREYVNGRYGEISAADELNGRRPPVVTECGHEAYSLPGQVTCPDCGGSGVNSRTAHVSSVG